MQIVNERDGDLLREKETERIGWDSLYLYILREYFDKIIPINVIVRIQDLMSKTTRIGRVISSKESYSYKLILECFQKYEVEIKNHISTKIFDKEVQHPNRYTQNHYDVQRGNYLMAIIERKLKK